MATIAQMLTQLVKDRAQMIDILKSKGVEANENSTLTELIPQLENISSEGGSNIYLVKSIEERDKLTPQDGTICLVHEGILSHMKKEDAVQVITFTKTVVLDSPKDVNSWCELRSDNFETSVSVNISKTMASFYIYSNSKSISISYTSTDGITFTRTDEGEDVIDLGIPVRCEYEWDDSIGYFIQIDDTKFGGIFEYKNDSWNYLNIGLKATPDGLYTKQSAYTNDGVIQGAVVENDYKHISIKSGYEAPTEVTSNLYLELDYDQYGAFDITKDTNFTILNTDIIEANKFIDTGKTMPEVLNRLDVKVCRAYIHDKTSRYLYVVVSPNGGNVPIYKIDLTTGENEILTMVDLPTSSNQAALEIIDNKLYFTSNNKFLRIDVNTKQVETLTNAPGSTAYPNYCTGLYYYKPKNCIYTCGGANIYEYSLDTNKWTTVNYFNSDFASKFKVIITSWTHLSIGDHCVGAGIAHNYDTCNVEKQIVYSGNVGYNYSSIVIDGIVYTIYDNYYQSQNPSTIRRIKLDTENEDTQVKYDVEYMDIAQCFAPSSNYFLAYYDNKLYKCGGDEAKDTPTSKITCIENLVNFKLNNSLNNVIIEIGDDGFECELFKDVKVNIKNIKIPKRQSTASFNPDDNKVKKIYIANGNEYVLIKDYTINE